MKKTTHVRPCVWSAEEKLLAAERKRGAAAAAAATVKMQSKRAKKAKEEADGAVDIFAGSEVGTSKYHVVAAHCA